MVIFNMLKFLQRKSLLRKLKASRIEKLVYIAMDIDYFQRVLESCGTEDDLRQKLKAEKEKDIKDQDIDLVAKLNEQINAVSNASKNIIDYTNVQRQLVEYLNYINAEGDAKIKQTLKEL